MATVKLKIDGIETEAEKGTYLLKVAQKLGIKIPTLCSHELLEPAASCRMCVVEVKRGRRLRLVTSCNYPAQDGIEVFTNSERVVKSRKMALEMLLARCSDVPVLKELGAEYGVEKSRFGSGTETCILCGMCVRICNDLVGAHVLGFGYRGHDRKLVTAFDREDVSDICISCASCVGACPTGHMRLQDLIQETKGAIREFPMGPRTAISIPFQQSVPKAPVIDPDACIHFQTGGCGVCAQVCEPGAINYDEQEEEFEIEVGQILVSTGYDLFNAEAMSQYGYGRFDNVISSLEFERMLNSTGPTGGEIRLKNGKVPRAIAIIHCVGSRDENHHKYCSRVCCMYALKFAHLVKDRTDAEVYQFYIDLRAFGKGYEEFYSRILDEDVNIIRGKVGEVVETAYGTNGDGVLHIHAEDTLIGKFRDIPVDMVVLCNALEPTHDAAQVANLFSLSRSPDGFLLERHPKLDPIGTINDGIYIAGACQGPKDIPDTVAQAQAAAARILGMISKKEVELDPIRAEIDEELCSGCRVCNNLCPYQAITFDEEKKVSTANATLCKGCGTCVAACPAGAISGSGFTDRQIFAEIDAILG